MILNLKKLAATILAVSAVIPAASAHAGISHTYNGISVVTLMIVLWTALALYEHIGDTVVGHWILFSAIFISLYIPAFHPHIRIDELMLADLVQPGTAVLAIGAVTWAMHRTDYLPRNNLALNGEQETDASEA